MNAAYTQCDVAIAARSSTVSVGDVRNMAGRAGRFGYRETGRAIILADTPFERQRLFRAYVTSGSEAISSSFAPGELSTWVVRLLRQVDHMSRDDVPTMLLNTYGGYLQSRRDVGFLERIRAEVPALLGRMEANGLISENDGGIFLTALGSACGQSTLSFESCLRLIEALRAVGNQMTSPEVILAVTESLPESDETYVPLQRRGPAEQRWSAAVRDRVGPTVVDLFSRRAVPLVAIARSKRTLIALAWADGVPLEQIESRFSVNPYNAVAAGDIRSIAESVRFRMRSAWEIAAVAFPQNLPPSETMDVLFTRLEFGIPTNALQLIRLGPGFSRADHLLLIGAGLRSPNEIWAIPSDALVQRLPRAMCERLERIRPH